MTGLIVSVFVASVVGGLHCAGMCGGLMAFAIAPHPGGPTEGNLAHRHGPGKVTLQAAYHGGRLIGYLTLSVAAGAVGSLLDLGGTLVGLSRVALIVAAAAMILFGIGILIHSQTSIRCGSRLGERLAPFAAKMQGKALRLPPLRRASLIGLSTPLLPCGWLYAFVVTAAGTGSVLGAMVVMAAFWAGTLPALVGLGVGLQTLLGATGKRLPTVTALLLIAVGIWTLVGRSGLDAQAIAAGVTPTEATSEIVVPDADDVPLCCATEASE
ncbi:MAG: sulfite exporter TauE/SafE family protein [Planctomycetota bacterium]